MAIFRSMHWTHGGRPATVTLERGDAAHATSPHAGQGASIALEDAYRLARALKSEVEIGTAFQLFDVTKILAYALAFVAIMLAIETFVVQPFERYVSRWRPRPA